MSKQKALYKTTGAAMLVFLESDLDPRANLDFVKMATSVVRAYTWPYRFLTV